MHTVFSLLRFLLMEYLAVQKIIYCKADCFFESVEVNDDPFLRFHR